MARDTRDRDFYVPSKAKVGSGYTDSYGSLYVVHKDGSLRRLKTRKHCTKNRV